MRLKLIDSLRTKWKGLLDNIVLQNDTKQYFEGTQNIHIIISSGVQAELEFDLEGKKDIIVTVKENSVYKGSIKSKKKQGTFKHVIILEGEHAEAHFFARLHCKDSEISDLDIIQLHSAAHTTSTVNIRSILEGNSHSLYQGLITIEKSAFNVSAHQENKVLIVSRAAKAISIPKLQVLNNDVQCGHGSAISHLDDEHIFYLVSRGIAQNRAKKIAIKAFLVE